ARFEAWQKITDDPIETCPTCGGPARRVLHPVGLVFKGSGFYKTDQRGSSGASVASGENSSNGATAAESTTAESKSTESKTTESKTTESKPSAEPAKSTAPATSTATATASE
ncbi:MAG TPA: FmdB family zinc ribbon protein, partial [Ktedonobacterales bacterium]